MPTNLHPECKARLIDALADGLRGVNTQHGMFIERMSAFISLFVADRVIPRGKVRDQLVSYVGDYPILEFVSDVLSRELRELDRYHADDPTVKLTDIEGYADTRALAGRLVEQIEALPWQYTLTAALPQALSEALGHIGEYALSPTVRIVRPDASFAARYPLNSASEKRHARIHQGPLLLGTPQDVQWDGKVAHIQIEATGFIGPYGGSGPTLEVSRSFKSICGLGLALRLFQIKRMYQPYTPKIYLYVHRRDENGWQIDNRLELDDETSRLMHELSIETLDGQLDTVEKKEGWAKKIVAGMRTVFSAGPKGNSLLLAAQWLFDGFTGRDELLNFVRAMVVLEILLGDGNKDDEIGLGELLRNRCAYLIASSQAQRQKILRDFAEIYRVRSQIVHRGKHRLNMEERSHLNTLHWMCRRVIQRELELLHEPK